MAKQDNNTIEEYDIEPTILPDSYESRYIYVPDLEDLNNYCRVCTITNVREPGELCQICKNKLR